MKSICYLDITWSLIFAPARLDYSDESRNQSASKAWYSVWRIIGSIEKLKELRVELDIPHSRWGEWRSREEEILEPIKQIKNFDIFVLLLPFHTLASPAYFDDFPCQILTNTGGSQQTI